MRAKAIAAVLALGAVAGLILPAGASAVTPASRQTKRAVIETISLSGSNGFRLEVELTDRRRLQVGAVLIGNDLTFSNATYALTAPQPRGSDDIHARIGNLGRIDVRFVPESVRESPSHLRGCSGGKITTESGHYVGLISFHGEGGYTRVRVHRAVGEMERDPPLICAVPKASLPNQKEGHKEPGGPRVEPDTEDVQLVAVDPSPRIAFIADRFSLAYHGITEKDVTFVATGRRRRGSIREISAAWVLEGKGSSFESPDPERPTSEAIIAPPAPFSGSATFRRESPHSASWTGNLSVALPGFGTVRLARPGIPTSMCEAPGCRSSFYGLSLPLHPSGWPAS